MSVMPCVCWGWLGGLLESLVVEGGSLGGGNLTFFPLPDVAPDWRRLIQEALCQGWRPRAPWALCVVPHEKTRVGGGGGGW